jgi:hypothetical protein
MAHKSDESIIDTISLELMEEGLDPESFESRRWLISRAQELHSIPVRANAKLLKDPERMITDLRMIFPGRMFLFLYAAKTQKTLQYWDRMPLVIPVERYRDGFLGINFHYLQPSLRFSLIDGLNKYRNNDKYDETTRLRLSYRLVTMFSRHRLVAPTLHRYLFPQIQSRVLWIQPMDWDVTLSLPCEGFVKQPKHSVWKDTTSKIHDRRN